MQVLRDRPGCRGHRDHPVRVEHMALQALPGLERVALRVAQVRTAPPDQAVRQELPVVQGRREPVGRQQSG